jgi:membrane protease YdiL (CAAX protease family)
MTSEIKTANSVKYSPFIFIISTFVITWTCTFLLRVAGVGNTPLGTVFNFVESASPLLVALFLLRNYLRKGRNLIHFFFGRYNGWLSYLLTLVLFILLFLNFYLFRTSDDLITPSAFGLMFLVQLFFGGGLEEGGWRGYLQPALEKKLHWFSSVLIVAVIWSAWHLQYWIIGAWDQNFFVFLAFVVLLSFILSAIYKLTGSVLLCSLYYGLQNTIVATIPVDRGTGFLLLAALQLIIAIAICFVYDKRAKSRLVLSAR